MRKKKKQIWTEMGEIGHPLMLCVFWYTSSNINKKNFSDSSSLWKISKFCFIFFIFIPGDILLFFGKFSCLLGKRKLWIEKMWNCLLQTSNYCKRNLMVIRFWINEHLKTDWKFVEFAQWLVKYWIWCVYMTIWPWRQFVVMLNTFKEYHQE